MRGIADRQIGILCGIALAGIAVWHARRGDLPAATPPPSKGLVDSARRQAFAFLRIPERIEPAAPTLQGMKFTPVTAPKPLSKDATAQAPAPPRRDPFYPEWYEPTSPDLITGTGPSEYGGPGGRAGTRPSKSALGKRSTAKPGSKLPIGEQCQYGGTMVLTSGKPAALVKNLGSGENVLLTEGESYRGVMLVQLDFFTATFSGPTGSIYRFSALVDGDKTFPAGDTPVAARSAEAARVDSPGGGVAESKRDRE